MILVFMLWSNLVLTQSHNQPVDADESQDIENRFFSQNTYRKLDIYSSSTLIAFCLFFAADDIYQLIFNTREYFTNFTSHITDLLPLITVALNANRSIAQPGPLDLGFWFINSVASVSLAAKFIWFLRSLDFFSYLILSLMQAAHDIRAFGAILIIACLCFADAFLSFSRSMGEKGHAVNYYESLMWIWLLVLG